MNIYVLEDFSNAVHILQKESKKHITLDKDVVKKQKRNLSNLIYILNLLNKNMFVLNRPIFRKSFESKNISP